MIDFIKRASLLVFASLITFSVYPSMTNAEDGWVHSPKPFDYKNGLLDDPDFLKIVNHDIPKEMIDNDISSRNPGSGGYYEFKSEIPFNISGIFVDGGGAFDRNYIKLVFSDGTIEYFNRKDNGYHELDLKGIISIELDLNTTSTSKWVNEIDFFGSYKKDEYTPVKVLSINETNNSISVLFEKPDEAQAVDVWLNNQKIGRTEDESYTYENLKPDTEYELMFVNYYGDDNYGAAVRKTVRTKKEAVREVSDLTATAASHEQVNLNWSNPNQSNFSHVTIYRDEVEKQSMLSKFKFFMVAHANDPTKLFETNGTYFIDHSVMASTQYEYLVTTTDDAGKESVGVIKNVTTPQKGKPIPPVSEIEKDENGDYLVTWTSPTEGKVKIVIDGKDYVVINASQGSYLIPGKDMVYGMLGQPKVVVIAIDSDGDESGGKAPGPPGSTDDGGKGEGDIGKVKLPFDASDVMRDIFSFIGTLNSLILLVLAIILTPLIIKLLKPRIMKKEEKRRHI